MMNHPPLKIGLIVDATEVPPYLYDLAAWAQTQPSIELSHLILQQLPATPAPRSKLMRIVAVLRKDGFAFFLSQLLGALILKIETLKLAKGEYANHHTRHDISPLVKNTLTVTPQRSASGLVYRYHAEDIAAIKAQQFDLLLRGGSGILRGEILSAARLGVLSFHHGDNRRYRGIPAGFWEVLHREPSTGFIIQQLTDELDAGHVLVRGAFPTLRYWLTNQAVLYTRSNHYLKTLLLRIATTHTLPPAEAPQPYSQPLFKNPTATAQLRYLLSLFLYRARHLIHARLQRQQRWGVAFARTGWQHLAMWKAQRIENPKGRFLADPFVITREGRDYCFVEDYHYATGRGVISVYELKGTEAVFLGEALAEPFHLSFPYLFEYEGTLYMVPESAQHNDIRIYESVNFPLEWKLATIAMRDVSAADSMIFYHQNYWWLFTNLNPLGHGDHCSELSAFYADNPLTDQWQPHALNPLLIDPTRARNGGILFDGDTIYRVVQRYGFLQYGAGASIHAIETLTPQHYHERETCRIDPDFFPQLRGTHHMHSNGTITVFDFVKSEKIA